LRAVNRYGMKSLFRDLRIHLSWSFGVSDASSVDMILGQAGQREKEYNWLGAAEFYGKALDLMSETDSLKKGEVQERVGYAFYRAAMQAESVDEFREKMHQAVASYEEAKEFYGVVSEEGKKPRILSCDAIIAYLGYWLTSEVSEKKRLLDKCWRLTKEALKACNEAGDQVGYGENSLGLTDCLDDRLDLELDMRMREKILDEALSLGEKAIRIFSNVGDEHELARAYCITSMHCYNAAMSLQLETKRKECEKKSFDYGKEAIRISESIGDKLLLSRSAVWLGHAELDLGAGSEIASELFKKALQYGSETKDYRILSEAFDGLAYSTLWNVILNLEEDIEKIREKSRKSEEYASQAIRCSTRVNHGRGIPHSYSFVYVTSLGALARGEIRLETRRELLRKAVALGKQGLEHAQCTGSTHAIHHASWMLAQALCDLSTMETGIEKRQLLEDAMTLGEKTVYYTEQLRPHFMLPQSIPHAILAMTLFELSKLEEKEEQKKELLEKSVSSMETCIALIQRHAASFPSRRELFASLGYYLSALGNILSQFYQATNEKEVLRKQIETYQNAVRMNKKADLVSRVAEAYWQTAVAYDRLGEYLESTRNFEAASIQYELSAHNIPQLNTFYMDYASYMQAWSDIERARHNHEREEYGRSKEHYEKAASALESSKPWSYLAPNYSAWAHLEYAEDLSRENQSQEAIQTFTEATNLFNQAKKSLDKEFDKILSPDEKDVAVKLSKVSDLREEYCLARILIEEARNLYTSGDCVSSAEKYESAAKKLEKIAQEMENESERKELLPLIHMCQAWQKMSVADEMADATLYAEASELFTKAKESSVKKRTAMLAAGNSCICRALEAGTKYKSTKNMVFYSEAKHYMESASDYYMDAGFEKASTWVSATEALFDSYFYMDKAETEAEHANKTKFYGLAEGYLDRSARLFEKAGYAKKADDVLKTLERVKEKREFALSLDKVLVAPSVTSSTASISVPTPFHEEAAGLDRFEHSNIQANLILRTKEIKVGEDLNLEIELVNTGKGQALLIKVEEIIPEDFEVKEAPEIYRVEDSYLNMKGKRLGPLKTEEVKLVLRPRTRGVFPLKPRILYLDESGKYKSHEPEPIMITVKELGISGWLKGER
jgi:tetratricopeptide (TPR) repeat protein